MSRCTHPGCSAACGSHGAPLPPRILLRQVRLTLGLSQPEMASRIGVTRGYLAHIERGRVAFDREQFAEAVLGLGRRPSLNVSAELAHLDGLVAP